MCMDISFPLEGANLVISSPKRRHPECEKLPEILPKPRQKPFMPFWVEIFNLQFSQCHEETCSNQTHSEAQLPFINKKFSVIEPHGLMIFHYSKLKDNSFFSNPISHDWLKLSWTTTCYILSNLLTITSH